MLDAMIEKGKGNTINKLRVMKIIEADFQPLMRMFLGIRIVDYYENDRRKSEHNYGSRKGFSMQSTLLRKGLIFDLVRKIAFIRTHYV